MTPNELKENLSRLVACNLNTAAMLWGAPGVGKSSIVAQVAKENKMELVDLRLSQLAPTDLRGLPVAKDGKSTWYPPEFLPTDGRGILFLDEINMAPPTLQGIAQQLVLDRRVGNYEIPKGWLVWAAGNRKEDRASVFDMPAPLANRFLHFEVQINFDSFRSWALNNSIDEKILAFLAFRPDLLHKRNPSQPAWPSPRSWEMASKLYNAQLSLAPAVGEAVEGEFAAFLQVYENIPDLGKIIGGGLPVGAYGGKSEIMAHISPEGPVYQAGTLSGNPISMAGGIAALTELNTHGLYDQLDKLGTYFANKLREVATENNVTVKVNQFGSMVGLFFTDSDINNFSDVANSGIETYNSLHGYLLENNIYFPPSGYETFFISTGHTKEHIDEVLGVFGEFCASLS